MPQTGPLSCDKCGDSIFNGSQSANQDARACGHRICAECKLEEKASEGKTNFAFPSQCCACGEPIISKILKNKHLNDLSPTGLFGDDTLEILCPFSPPRFSSKVQSVLDKLIGLDAERVLETDEPVKRQVSKVSKLCRKDPAEFPQPGFLPLGQNTRFARNRSARAQYTILAIRWEHDT
jgi:hypothetical protein